MRLWHLACLASVLSIASNAHAGSSARLVYARSMSARRCPDQATLETAVARRLGYSPFFPWADQTIVAEVTGEGETLTARARLVDRAGLLQGSREFTGPAAQCDELIASLALAISITLDPMSVTREPPAISEPERTPIAPAPQLPEERRASPPPLARESTLERSVVAKPIAGTRLVLYAGPLLRLFALPSAVPGVRAGARLERGVFSWGVEASTSLSSSQHSERGGVAVLSLWAANTHACLGSGPIGICALATLGSLRGEGRQVAVPRTDSELFVALGVRLRDELSLGAGWALEANIDLQKTLTRPTFQLDDTDVFRPSPFVLDAGLALSRRFF
jgi:hypothetical protein